MTPLVVKRGPRPYLRSYKTLLSRAHSIQTSQGDSDRDPKKITGTPKKRGQSSKIYKNSKTKKKFFTDQVGEDFEGLEEEARPRMDELQFEKLGFRSKLVQVFSGKPKEWRRFKVKLQAALEEADLLETLESEKPVVSEGATQGERKALATWVKNDRKIYSKLILYTSNDAGSLVEQFESSRSGKLAWDALKAKYDPKGRAGKVDLYRDLMAAKLEDGEDPDKVFLRMEGNRRQLQDMEQTVSDEMLLGMTLSKLPPSYDTLVTILEADDELTYDDMKEQVRAYWKRKVQGSLSQDAAEVKCFSCC